MKYKSFYQYTDDIKEIKKSLMEDACEDFETWYQKEKDTSWTNDLPDCPCKLDMSKATMRNLWMPGNPDPENFVGPTILNTIATRIFHPGAKWDLRSKAGEKHGQQCCYDKNGELITHGLGAGTADKINPSTDKSGHFKDDVKPFKLAQACDNDELGPATQKYIQVRPPNVGKGCKLNKK